MDLESLKLDADALGVKYRSDIKAETLQAKIDEHNKTSDPGAVPKEWQTDEPTYQTYKNTSGINYFTEAGRCSPGKTVQLTKAEALQYKDLECVS